jgi:hypothetical protein
MLKGQAHFAQGALKKEEMIWPEVRLATKGLMNTQLFFKVVSNSSTRVWMSSSTFS